MLHFECTAQLAAEPKSAMELDALHCLSFDTVACCVCFMCCMLSAAALTNVAVSAIIPTPTPTSPISFAPLLQQAIANPSILDTTLYGKSLLHAP